MDKIRKIPGRIAAINDLSGFGRCSLSLMMPVISACGYQCCPIPTAVLSSSNDFPSPFLRELTEDMGPYMDHWKTLDLRFQGIYTGYFSSTEQMALARRFADLFLEKDTVLLVDPVMGDRGFISPRCSEKFVAGYYDLIRRAHIVTPNLTEALYLTGIPYEEAPRQQTLDLAADRLLAEETPPGENSAKRLPAEKENTGSGDRLGLDGTELGAYNNGVISNGVIDAPGGLGCGIPQIDSLWLALTN